MENIQLIDILQKVEKKSKEKLKEFFIIKSNLFINEKNNKIVFKKDSGSEKINYLNNKSKIIINKFNDKYETNVYYDNEYVSSWKRINGKIDQIDIKNEKLFEKIVTDLQPMLEKLYLKEKERFCLNEIGTGKEELNDFLMKKQNVMDVEKNKEENKPNKKMKQFKI